MSIEHARAVADAVLYEGYLLYPYRASSQKNQTRFQFGVLGPPGAAEGGVGEAASMSFDCVVRPGPGCRIAIRLRFLQLQERTAEKCDKGGFVATARLTIGTREWLSWDEAIEREVAFGPLGLNASDFPRWFDVDLSGGVDEELLRDVDGAVAGRLLRRRWPIVGRVSLDTDPCDGFVRLHAAVVNTAQGVAGSAKEALRTSFLGAHLLLSVEGGEFVSLLDPPEEAQSIVDGCHQNRCWPVLAGPPDDTSVLLGSPIIIYDHPQIAEQSAGALFDSTEIDEILTLRVLTMTDEEKAEARATDPRAAEIIDRCDALSPEQLGRMHGVLRDAAVTEERWTDLDVPPVQFATDGPWWEPEPDDGVYTGSDPVIVDGIQVSKGSIVRLHPGRRADAQDLFFSDQLAKVTSVRSDFDGNTHIAVVLLDDPASDMHEWYGRSFYFAPDEVEPLAQQTIDHVTSTTEESP